MVQEKPSGIVTFLFSDMEGSTSALRAAGESFAQLLGDQRRLLREAWSAHGGVELGTEGDSFFVAFAGPESAIEAAVQGQVSLQRHAWPGGRPVAVRMGIHSGPAAIVGDDYIGLTVHEAARVAAAARGNQILVSAITASLARPSLPAEIELTSLGRFVLKDIEQPFELLQVAHPDLVHDERTPNAQPQARHNLPLLPTVLVGRERELRELTSLIASHQLVTIVAAGGAGKTRLATALAGAHVDLHPDGTWFVDLSALRDPSHVLGQVVRVLDGPTGGDASRLPLTEALATAEMLLILDNCEHVVEACAEIVASLLATCPGVRVLTTSQEPLRIGGEAVWGLPPLSEGVDLFIQRAASIRVGYTPSADDLDVIAQICRRLDGSPLAIELAAARSVSLGPQDILDRLDDRFRLLTSSRRDAPGRHQSLRAAIEWSYDLLDEPHQCLLGQLGAFAGSFDLAAAEHVADDPRSVADVLGTLVERSLVVATRDSRGVRYRLLETVAAFAREKLVEAANAEVAEERVARWAVDSAAKIAGSVDPNQFEAVLRLEIDLDNHRSALRWLRTNDPSAGLQLVVDLGRLWVTRLNLDEGTEWVASMLASAAGADPALLAEAQSALATLFRLQNRLREARDAAAASLRHGTPPMRTALPARVILGQILALQGELAEARALFLDHLHACEANGDVFGRALALREIGSVAFEAGDIEEASRNANAAFRLAAGATWLSALVQGDRVRIALRRGDLMQARSWQEEILTEANRVGAPRAIAAGSLGLARVYRYENLHAHAGPLLAVAGQFFATSGDLLGVAHVLVEGALLAQLVRDWSMVAIALASAADIRRDADAAVPGAERDDIQSAVVAARAELGNATFEEASESGRLAGPRAVLDQVVLSLAGDEVQR